MGRLGGKTTFISGAGAGIARASALMFAREGAAVVVAEIDEESGRGTEQMIRAAGGDALFVRTDVSAEQSVKDAVASGVRHFGKLDVLFNCAGGPLADDSYVTDVALEVCRPDPFTTVGRIVRTGRALRRRE